MSWRRQSRAGAEGERGLALVTAGEGGRPVPCADLCASRGEGPLGSLRPKLPKQSECRENIGATPQIIYPSLTAIPVFFLPIIQKLEFGPRFHVPNYVFTDLGQEKTERRESFYSALKKKKLMNGKNHLPSLQDLQP